MGTTTALRYRVAIVLLVGCSLLGSLLWISGEARGGTGLCQGEAITLRGTASSDQISGTPQRDVIDGRAGGDTIDGGGGNDVLCGGPGSDRISGGNGTDSISGEDGNDRLDGGRGTDDMLGDAGSDYLLGLRGNDRLDGGDDGDRVEGGFGDDSANGGPGSGDVVDGGLGIDVVSGGDGDGDVVSGGRGRDSLDGGTGASDVVSYATFVPLGVSTAPLTISLTSGTSESAGEGDTLVGFESVEGSAFADRIEGDGAANSIAGGGGDDNLFARPPDFENPRPPDPGDVADGGPGSDNCFDFEQTVSCGFEEPAPPNTTVGLSRTGQGLVLSATSVSFEGQKNRLSVARRGTTIVVTDLAGVVSVGLCKNVSDTQTRCRGPRLPNRVRVDVGSGPDVVRISSSVPPAVTVEVDGGEGADHLIGGRGNDALNSGEDFASTRDLIEGKAGSDALVAASGPDRLVGGAGDDLLITSSPCDSQSYAGSAGIDSLSFAQTPFGVEATLGEQSSGQGCEGTSRIDVSVESFEGSPFSDRLTGSPGFNRILGRAGDDIVVGGRGDDRLVGGSGIDTFEGGAGEDRLFARDGLRDRRIRCGPGGRLEYAVRDSTDPSAVSC